MIEYKSPFVILSSMIEVDIVSSKMLLEDDQMRLSKEVEECVSRLLHAIFSPCTASTVHVWIGPRLLIGRYCLLFSELQCISFVHLLFSNYAGIIYLALQLAGLKSHNTIQSNHSTSTKSIMITQPDKQLNFSMYMYSSGH